MSKTAVILFNLGGPDSPEAVKPFLFNLFMDPAIIGAPLPIRYLLARWISFKRAPIAREIYQHLGGKSPLLGLTQDQAAALDEALNQDPNQTFKSFIAMRYWHPMSLEAAERVRDWGPDRVILLPLYPQYSTTTSGSSIEAWKRAAAAVGLSAQTRTICCYPKNPGFISAMAESVKTGIEQAKASGKPRVLFSAHGLPKKIIEKGDPYQWQVEQTAEAIVAALGQDDLDWLVCYQSRVGPLEWIGPSTDSEIERAGRDGVPLVVVPLAFVSEHSETLVELDIEYRELAEHQGVPAYVRVPTVCSNPQFINGLAAMVQGTLRAWDVAKVEAPPETGQTCAGRFSCCGGR